MRFLVRAAALLLLAGAAFAAVSYPALSGRVTDAANILKPDTRAELDGKLADLEQKSSIQLVVATVPSLEGDDIESYANGLFRAWKLGEAKANNGVLLLVAPNEHKVRIEVGYGLEGTITDALSSVIIQSAIVPKFKSGDYAAGVDRGVDALISAMTDDQSQWHQKARVRQDGEGTFDGLMPLLVVALFAFVFISMVRNARRGGGRGGGMFIPPGSFGGGFGGGSWGGGGGFSSGGGFGGGFGGGGGSSGGGGASGGW